MSPRRRPSGSIDDEETSIYEDTRPKRPKRPKKDTRPGPERAPEAQQAIRVISMKTPGAPRDRVALEVHTRAVKLRALSEVSGPAIQLPLGNLAPPRDAKETGKRRTRDYLIVGGAIAIVGILVALGFFLLAH